MNIEMPITAEQAKYNCIPMDSYYHRTQDIIIQIAAGISKSSCKGGLLVSIGVQNQDSRRCSGRSCFYIGTSWILLRLCILYLRIYASS